VFEAKPGGPIGPVDPVELELELEDAVVPLQHCGSKALGVENDCSLKLVKLFIFIKWNINIFSTILSATNLEIIFLFQDAKT